MASPKPLQEPLSAARGIPSSYNQPLRAVLVAPQAVLHRESVAGEEAVIGAYTAATGGSYDIPDRDPALVLDETNLRLLMRNAELEVYARSTGVDGTVAPLANYKNRLNASAINFQSNGDDYPLSSQLAGREVKVGDKVVYGATPSSEYIQHETTVIEVAPITSAASVGSATANAGNKTTQGAGASSSQVAGALNWVTGSGSASGYDDLNGGVNRIYTVVVIAGGDETSARLKVISSDGLDNVASVTPAAFSSPTSIGTKGLTFTFTLDNGRPVDSGVPDDIFVIGQKWEIAAADAFTAPTATAGGTYSGTADVTYIITVTRGGLYASGTRPEITVTTDTGVDASGPTSITDPGTNFAVGTKGVVVQFNQTGLNKGDVYYIPATAVANTNMRTLVLKDDLPDDLLGVSDGDLSIRVIDPLMTVRPFRLDDAPNYNWQLDDPQIVVEAGITGTLSDGTLLNESNEAWYVPVITGTMIVEYREWSAEAANRLITIDTIETAKSELVSIDKDNPAGYLIANMLQCSNGNPVGFIGVPNPNDVESWRDSIDSLEDAENCYHICLGTDDPLVIDILQEHLDAQNDSAVENFRVGVTALRLPSDMTIVGPASTSDETTCLVTIADNPGISNTQYNYVSSTNGNFVTNGVKAGDVLRTAYTADAYGTESYSEFVVSSVINENTLVTVTSSDIPYSVPQRAEVHRNASARDKVTYATEAVATRRSTFMRMCVPDAAVDNGGEVVEGYAVACSLAAALSAVPPHQPFNYFEIPGYSRVYGTGYYFTPKQLKDMERAGLCVFDDDGAGMVFIRRCVTTDNTDETSIEEVVVRNDHAMKLILRVKLSYYRGQAMNVPSVISKLALDAQTAIREMADITNLPLLGAMVDRDSTISARRHATLQGWAVLEITGERPFPMNEFTTSLIVPLNNATGG
jgi:hypothetical protein